MIDITNKVTEDMYEKATRVKKWHDVNGNPWYAFMYEGEKYVAKQDYGISASYFTNYPINVSKKKELLEY